jgi:DNA-binding NarL/FixJ family response regulator
VALTFSLCKPQIGHAFKPFSHDKLINNSLRISWAPPLYASLTIREMEVLRLLAQGLTSAQIAERLVIGLVTVNSHVRSIYSKCGVTSRSAATRYAMEHKLV